MPAVAVTYADHRHFNKLNCFTKLLSLIGHSLFHVHFTITMIATHREEKWCLRVKCFLRYLNCNIAPGVREIWQIAGS